MFFCLVFLLHQCIVLILFVCQATSPKKFVSFKPVYSDRTGLTDTGSEFSSFASLPMHPPTIEKGFDFLGLSDILSPMCSGLNPKNLFNRSPTPPSSGSASSGGTSHSIAGVSSFAQQSYHIEAHRRAVWNAFWRRVFSARNVYLADIALLDSQSAGIFFMDSSIMA